MQYTYLNNGWLMQRLRFPSSPRLDQALWAEWDWCQQWCGSESSLSHKLLITQMIYCIFSFKDQNIFKRGIPVDAGWWGIQIFHFFVLIHWNKAQSGEVGYRIIFIQFYNFRLINLLSVASGSCRVVVSAPIEKWSSLALTVFSFCLSESLLCLSACVHTWSW